MKLLSTTILALAFVACGKEDSKKPEAKQSCEVLKTNVYDSGVVKNTLAYEYSNGLISKVTLPGKYFTLEYDGSKITRRNFFTAGSTELLHYDMVSYNSNGTIAFIERHDIKNANDVLNEKMVFNYTANKLTNITIIDGNLAKQAEYNYSYTINNIHKLEATEYWNVVPESYSLTFRYDNKTNFFATHQQALLTDGYFFDKVATSVPYVLSDNNVIGVGSQGMQLPITYTLNANNNVSEVRMNGNLLMAIDYKCQ